MLIPRLIKRAWPLGQYPCIGQWLFLYPGISAFPNYQAILSRVKHSATVLDLGCALGQDLRRLAADGAPSENMYASDLQSELWDIGYDPFRDRDRKKARFIQADIFDPNTPLRELNGKMDIIIACQLLHLFSWTKTSRGADEDCRDVQARNVRCGLLGGDGLRPVELDMPRGLISFHNVDSFNDV